MTVACDQNVAIGQPTHTTRTTLAHWPLVVVHALVNVVAFTTADVTTATDVTGDDVLVSVVYAAMFTVYGILVLRGLSASPDARINVEA